MICLEYYSTPFPDIPSQSLIESTPLIVLEEGRSIGEITLIFCSDEELLLVNQQHLNHDYYTDIITFDYCSENVVSGDLFLSMDRIKENAIKLMLVLMRNSIASYFMECCIYWVITIKQP